MQQVMVIIPVNSRINEVFLLNERPMTACAAALFVVAIINFQGVISSPRWEQIRTVDDLRLFAGGLLAGVALVTLVRHFRDKAKVQA